MLSFLHTFQTITRFAVVTHLAEDELSSEARSLPRPSQPSPQMQHGLPQNFEALYQDYARALFGYLWRMTGDEQAANDLTQETFVRAWQHFEHIRTYDRPDSWLFKVATNLAINQHRRKQSPVATPVELTELNAGVGRDPGSVLPVRDLVRQILLELTPHQRAALVLREVYGLSCEEIAQALGSTRDNIKSTLYRAREQFRARYTQANSDPPRATSIPTLLMIQDDRLPGETLRESAEGEE